MVDNLYHSNIGTFIASHGFTVVIPDYRLLPTSSISQDPIYKYEPNPTTDALFPSGAEDVYLSLLWSTNNVSEIADTETVYALGHSAGANHVITACLLPQFIPSSPLLLSRVKKISTLSATFSYIHSREARKVAWSNYFGGIDNIPERCPQGLIETLPEGVAKALLQLYCCFARRDYRRARELQPVFWNV
jgi:acetyl esterase/lipase